MHSQYFMYTHKLSAELLFVCNARCTADREAALKRAKTLMENCED